MPVQPRNRVRCALATIAILLIPACSESSGPAALESSDPDAQVAWWAANPAMSKAIAALRDTTDQFQDVNVARAAGYRASAAGCESAAEGAMGIHHGHPSLLGLIPRSNPTTGTDAVIDPLRPEVLMYEPQSDGSLRLVGVEFVVYRAAWDAVNSSLPTFAGMPFDQKFGPDAHGHADHYELHIWLWRHNPRGMFAPWNPKVSCST